MTSFDLAEAGKVIVTYSLIITAFGEHWRVPDGQLKLISKIELSSTEITHGLVPEIVGGYGVNVRFKRSS